MQPHFQTPICYEVKHQSFEVVAFKINAGAGRQEFNKISMPDVFQRFALSNEALSSSMLLKV